MGNTEVGIDLQMHRKIRWKVDIEAPYDVNRGLSDVLYQENSWKLSLLKKAKL